jgi:L-alanine-DL-glutamate epimerase-like enolase superfamily enzyme
MPEGFTTFKNDIHPVLGIPMGRFTDTLDQAQLKAVARAYNNAREALGDDIEIAVHCHNEFNEISSVGIAKAVASMNPLFIEDF